MRRVVVVERLPLHDVTLADRKPGGTEHADLLGLAVVDRRLSAERVQVIVRECLLGHRRRGAVHLALHSVEVPACQRLTDAVEIAGHELHRRVPEGRPASVGERHPSVDVGRLVVARHGQDVIGAPRELPRQIRGLDAVVRRAAVVDRPDERRPGIETLGQLGKADVVGMHPRDDLVADLPHRRAVIAEEPSLHGLLPRGAAVLQQPHERNVAAHVLVQQLLGLEQVVFVILLEHADARGLAERAEMHRRRIHRRRNVHEAKV